MKKLLLMTLLFSATYAQAKFSQIIYISATSADVTKVNGLYQFENNDVKISYVFWADGGIVGFSIYNKTGHPIYIDWKKSALIYNGRQFPYYTNKTTSNFSTYGRSYGYAWADMFGINSASASTMNGQETIVKQERITFVPPHSYISNAFYNILANTNFSFDKQDNKKTQVNGVDAYVIVPHNPIAFRNFITYSASEDFTAENYTDNEFIVSKVVTIHSDKFGSRDDHGYYSNDWQKPTRFYISDIKRSDVFEQ